MTFVEVRSNGWDTHQQNHEHVGKLRQPGRPGVRRAGRRPEATRGCSSRTLVVWMGEFGRTPKINPTQAATTSPGSSTSPWPAAASRVAR